MTKISEAPLLRQSPSVDPFKKKKKISKKKEKRPSSIKKSEEGLLGECLSEGVIRGETTYKGGMAACYSLILRLGLV